MYILHDKRGFTLIELLVSLAILGMVIGLGYMFFDYNNSTFNRGEERWIAQKNARLASDYTVRQLESGLYYELDPSDALESGESDLWVRNGNLVQKAYGDSDSTIVVNGRFGIQFSKVNGTDSKQIPNVVSFTLNSYDSHGNLVSTKQSAVKLHNMIVGRGTTGDNSSGSVIRFARTNNVAPVPTGGSSRCFIATAAYGSPSKAPVMLLRQFRDRFLLTNATGCNFVNFYYRNSPPVAALISHSNTLRLITRIVLAPVVGLAWLALHCGPVTIFLCLVLVIGAIAGIGKRKILSIK